MRDYDSLVCDLHICGGCNEGEVCQNCSRFSRIDDYENGDAVDPCSDELLLDAADAIEELLDELTTIRKQLPHWISVEKPPNDERNVFICHGNADFKAPCIGHYDASMKRFYEDKNWFASPIYDAMFWCEMPKLPLPEPPKGVE